MILFWKIFFWRLPLPIGPLIIACLAWWGFSHIDKRMAVHSAVKDLVAGAEIKALQSQIAERDRQIRAGQIVIDAYQEIAKNDHARDEQAAADLEARISQRALKGPKCPITDEDIQFLEGK